MLRLSSLCLLAASGLLGLAVAVSGFDAWSQQAAHAADLQRKSVADLAQAARQGNAAEAADVIAELHRRAALGDRRVLSTLDALLEEQANGGNDAALSALIGRARAGDKEAKSFLFMTLPTLGAKGDQTAVAELRRAANSGHGGVEGTRAESDFDAVLTQLASNGDTAALAELRGRSEAAMGNGVNTKTFIDQALGKLADLGDQAALEALRHSSESGDGEARNTLGMLYFYGTAAVKRDISMAATIQGCPLPDVSITESCHSVQMDALPKAVLQLVKALNCDDSDPSPVAIKLGGTGSQYKLACYEPGHGPSGAVVIGQVHGAWKDITSPQGLLGFDDECWGFFPLKTIHHGLRDVCLSDECTLRRNSGPGARCVTTVWEFDGERYRER
jgi:hypothetical protein